MRSCNRENLLLGLTLNDDRQACELLAQIQLRSWLDYLPLKLDTCVENKAARLSAGERHRLALARALLRNPSILLLDETTSALDPDLEKDIWQTVDVICAKQTL